MSGRRLSNPDKVLFPDADITKQRLAGYHERIADRLLPHVAGRPLVLHRFPDGIDEQGFFQKNTPDHVPEEIGRVEIPKADGGSTTYAVVETADDLVYLADQAAIVLHTLLVRADVIDEDADFELTKRFSLDVAEIVASRLDDVTTEQRKERRRGRLFLDVLRNAPVNHAVAPYSVRALPSAPVAAPLDWSEALSSSFDPRRITLDNIFRRLGQRADPWATLERPASTIATAHEALDDHRVTASDEA